MMRKAKYIFCVIKTNGERGTGHGTWGMGEAKIKKKKGENICVFADYIIA